MKKSKVVVLGKGFLGQAFERAGYRVFGKDEIEITTGDYSHLSRLNNYDVLINCIGKSDTRGCEKPENWKSAFFANAEIPRLLSEFCLREGIKFVHISTGCLYDDKTILQRETDFLAAHCNYTATKWVGEKNCSPERDLIVRPRLLFGDFVPEKNKRNNLLCKLPGFDNFLVEENSYTSVHIVVDAVQALVDAEQSGIFNVACDGEASVRELARWCGLHGGNLTGEELRKQENLFLVSNTMDLTKLHNFYQPPKLENEIKRCWRKLK